MRRSILLALTLALAACTAPAEERLQTGDILFHTSRSSQSRAIQLATHSPYSHMGMIFFLGGKPHVFEAVGKVTFTPLEEWIRRGEDGRYAVKRLRDAGKVLTRKAEERLLRVAREYEGRPYDLYFEWSDDRIYCSELVWKIFRRALGREIGALQRLGDFDLSHPKVRKRMAQRYGARPPLDEPVISPAAMFGSELLVTVPN